MRNVMQDLRYGVRSLIKQPLLTVVCVLTLGLGIGANTAIFGVVRAVVLRPLPYRDPDRLVMVWATMPKKDRDTMVPADFRDFREQSRSFEQLAGFSYSPANLTGGKPERVTAASVTANFFATLGVQPASGRFFSPPGDAAGTAGEKLVVISYPLWRSHFAADRGVIGRDLRINGQVYTVAGVAAPGFAFPDRAEIWLQAPRDVPELAAGVDGDPATMRGLSYMRAFGRLKPGVTLAQAQSDMDAIARRMGQQFPDTNAKRGVALVTLRQQVVGDVRPAMLMLLGGVVLVLLIACANVASLLFARSTAREREIGLRTAIGADRGRILRQLVTESLLLGLVAGAFGLLLGYWGLQLLVRLSPGDIPRLNEISLDPGVLAFTLGVTLLTGLLVGLLPALQTFKSDLVAALREGGSRATTGTRRRRIRGMLVVAEIAVALILLVGAGLLLKSFVKLQQVSVGFNAEKLLTLQISLPGARYAQPRQQAAFFSQALERVGALPGVQSAAIALSPPLSGEDINIPFAIAGQNVADPGDRPRDGFQLVSASYFQAMEIPILAGRPFGAADMNEASATAILSAAMARRYWPGRDPIGQTITYDNPKSAKAKWLTVVGIAGDVKHFGLDKEARAEAYVPYPQMPFPMMFMVLRSAVRPESLVSAVRAEIARIDPDQPIAEVKTMHELLASSVTRPRFTAYLMAAFAGLALVLAAVGIYGLMAYSVAQRGHELGIRMALGAQRSAVVQQVVRQGMTKVLVGVGLGLAGALILTRILRSLLFEVTTTDLATFVAVPLLLVFIALLANLLPALRAAQITPLVALKSD